MPATFERYLALLRELAATPPVLLDRPPERTAIWFSWTAYAEDSYRSTRSGQ